MLTNEQIQFPERNCKKNGIRYYYVQPAVIDHMAGMLDELQQEPPSVGYMEALEIVNSQFTKRNFRLMVENKKQQLKKRISPLIEKAFLSFFTVPRIALTVLPYAGAWLLPDLLQQNKTIGILYIILLTTPFLYYFIHPAVLVNGSKAERDVNLLNLKVGSRYWMIVCATAVTLNIFLNVGPRIAGSFCYTDNPSVIVYLHSVCADGI